MGQILKAGFGKIALPSPVGVELCGYGYYLGRKCIGVNDVLHVRCVALEAADAKSLVISADLIGLTEELVTEIRRLIEDKYGYAGREVLLVCTHTHTGPATNRLEGCGIVNDEYNATLPPLFLDAVSAALADLAPVDELEEVAMPIEPIGYNRNVKGGIHDAVVRGLRIKRTGTLPIALVSYPCHPVTIGPSAYCSADYPGAVCDLGEKQGMQTIFLNGCCGDIDPVINLVKWGSGTNETLKEYAELIINGFLKGLHPVADKQLANSQFGVDVHLKVLDKAGIDDMVGRASNAQVAEVWRNVMLSSKPVDKESVMVRALRLGPMVFCSFPFETFTIVGDIVRQTYAGKNISVLGCGDHTRSYLPVVTPELQYSYPVIAAAMLYYYPIIAVGAAESIGKQIAENIADII